MLFDTHTHLHDPKFDEDREEVIEKIKASGVSALVNIGCDVLTSDFSIKLAHDYDFIYATVGVHPCDTADMTEEHLDKIRELAKDKKVIAIGEIGLDYYWDNVERDVQKYWFKRQLELAEELDMPIVIHNRDAHEDTYNILKDSKAKGIMHCFSGSKEMAERFLKLGYYISFAGPLTFKNNVKSVEAAKVVPMDRLLIETDAPYLAPDGFRGKRNDSSLVRYTCEKLAEIKGVSFEEMAHQTLVNAKRVYRIDDNNI